MSEPLTVVLLTYERTEYAVRTIKAASQLLYYPDWVWFVADDGSSEEHCDALAHALEESGRPVWGISSIKGSYGESANRGLDVAFQHGNLVLMLEDDWELTEPLDIWKYAALLMERPDIGMVRMGYLNAGVAGSVIAHQGSLYWALDDQESRKHSSFAWAGHPALIHRRMFEMCGYYPERWQPGETELHMCWQVSEFREPMIVWPAELGMAGPWAHIGGEQSYTWNGGVQL